MPVFKEKPLEKLNGRLPTGETSALIQIRAYVQVARLRGRGKDDSAGQYTKLAIWAPEAGRIDRQKGAAQAIKEHQGAN